MFNMVSLVSPIAQFLSFDEEKKVRLKSRFIILKKLIEKIIGASLPNRCLLQPYGWHAI